MVKRKSQTLDIRALLQGGFSEDTARQLYAQGEEIAIFVMMQLAALAKKSVDVKKQHGQQRGIRPGIRVRQQAATRAKTGRQWPEIPDKPRKETGGRFTVSYHTMT